MKASVFSIIFIVIFLVEKTEAQEMWGMTKYGGKYEKGVIFKMDENELADIRKKKLEQMQNEREDQIHKEQQIAQAKNQIDSALRNVLAQDAWEQWNTARFGNEENAYAAAQVILQAVQSGQLRPKISKEQIRTILGKVSDITRKEFRITRR